MSILDKIYNQHTQEEIVEEGFANTISKNTKSAKIDRLAGGMALRIAKERNDPLVAKMLKAKHLYMRMKEMINRKYGAKGMMAAKKAALK